MQSEGSTQAELPPQIRELQALHRNWMLFINPPRHTRLRSLVHQAFTPKMVQALSAQIEARAHALLDSADGQSRFDLIAGYAHPLPVDVIAQILGIPIADRAAFARWSVDLGRTLDLTAGIDALLRGGDAAISFDAYLRGLIDERRMHLGDDLLSALIQAEQTRDRLSEDELIATCVLLLLAGHETTQNLIGNGVHALLRHPAQLARLQAEPALMKPAIEELLRYDSPVQFTSRCLREDVKLGDFELPRGTRVALLIGSAHRDANAFAEPDRLDLARQDNPHVAFGAGIHFCLGAMLARTEATIALRVLLSRLPGLSLAKGAFPAYRDMLTLRGLESLPVHG
jgi:cytochrome P450